jgi:hypothetical protein
VQQEFIGRNKRGAVGATGAGRWRQVGKCSFQAGCVERGNLSPEA